MVKASFQDRHFFLPPEQKKHSYAHRNESCCGVMFTPVGPCWFERNVSVICKCQQQDKSPTPYCPLSQIITVPWGGGRFHSWAHHLLCPLTLERHGTEQWGGMGKAGTERTASRGEHLRDGCSNLKDSSAAPPPHPAPVHWDHIQPSPQTPKWSSKFISWASHEWLCSQAHSSNGADSQVQKLK